MTIFAVVSTTGHLAVDQAVAIAFPQTCFHVASGHWLVRAVGTTKDVSNRVGFADGQSAVTGMVYSVAGYFGLANPQVWEWLASNRDIPGG